MKYYSLLNRDGTANGVFRGNQPRQAALKAACRGVEDIILREHGVLDKVHVFVGSREKKPVPTGAPEWLKTECWTGKVKKIGVKTIGEVVNCG